MPYPFAPGEVLTAANLNAALDMRMLTSGTSLAFTPGALLFGSTAGGFQTDAANLFWDDTNNRLGIKTTAPQAMLHVGGSGTGPAGTARSYQSFTDAANGTWAYMGDWAKTVNAVSYGSDFNGTGVARGVAFQVGGVEAARFGATGFFGLGVVPVHYFQIGGVATSTAYTYWSGTQTNSNTANQYGLLSQVTASPTGLTLSNLYGGIFFNAAISASATAITNYYSAAAQPRILVDFTGTIGNVFGYYSFTPSNSTDGFPVSAFAGFTQQIITNSTGATTGTITNRGFHFPGSTAASGGATMANYGMQIILPSGGATAGTNTNIGLNLSGNGGTAAGGTVSNWSIWNSSTADVYLSQGRVGIKNTTPQTDLHVGSVAATARVYNAFTDSANGEWTYAGDWGPKFPNTATYGSDKNGTGIARDVNFIRGGVEMIRLAATGVTAPGGIVSTPSSTTLPVLLGTGTMAGAVRGVTVMGDYAYTINQLAGATDTLEIFDITIPTAPIKIGGLPFAAQGLGNGPLVAGQVLYSPVNAAAGGMMMVDVSNPKLPVSLGVLNVGGQIVQAFAVSGGYLYMGHTSNVTFRIYDIVNPAAPALHSSLTLPGANGTRGIIVSGKYAYVTTGQAVTGVGGLYIVDVSDPAVPTVVTYNTIGAFSIGMAITGKYLYVCSGGGTAGAIIEIVDISDPSSPQPVTTFATTGSSGAPHPIIAGDYLYHINNTANGVQVFNIANPISPVSVGTVATVAPPLGAALRGNRLYITANSQLRIYNTFGFESSSIRTGAIATDILSVDGTSYFAGDMYAQRGLIVGQQGIHSRGPIFTDASEAAIPVSAVFGLGLVCFGGFGNVDWPALKRSGVALQVRLSDDSAYTGFEALSLALGGAGVGSLANPLDIRRDFDGIQTMTLTNASTGVGAQARAIYSNDASTGQLMLGVMGTLATTNGVFLQDGAYISAEAGLAGGLNLMTRAAAPIRFATNGQANERMQITSAGLITFGGITSAFPALKRNLATLEVRLADDSGYTNLVTSWLGVNGQTPTVPFDMRGTFTSSIEATLFNIAATIRSTVTAQQSGGSFHPIFQPTGASLSYASGMEFVPSLNGTVAINEASACDFAIDITSYTGSNLSLAEMLYVGGVLGGTATKRITTLYGLLVSALTNGSGVTSGSISNYGIAVAGPSAGAGVGGTVSNLGLNVSVPSGSGAGTTANYGVYINGNGGSGGGGSTTNYALLSDSTALSIMGSLRIGNFSGSGNPTNATAPMLYITAVAGQPTATPLYSASGAVAIQFDTTNKKLWAFDTVTNTWKGVVLT